MKKINTLTTLALIGVALIISSCHHTKSSNLGLAGEDVIDLNSCVITPSAEGTFTSYAVSALSLNGTSLASQTVTLSIANINTLYTQAKKLLGSGGAGYITGLYIYYGVNNSTLKMTYYFLPVCLQATPAPSGAGTYTYYPTSASAPSASNPFYTINSAGTFTLDAGNQINSDTTSYKNDISIIHYTGDTYPHYMNFPTYPNNQEDCISIIFPFQEIKQYVSDNSIPSTGSIVLYNTCVQVTTGGISYMRHDISIGNPTGSTGGIFSCNYADFGHMTPPDQQNLSYTITALGTGMATSR